jgi:DNA sulfur modification protein DndC
MALNIQHLENEIIDQYLYDENATRPWIIGFSGGKDSTMLLQTVWKALQKIDPILLTRQVHIVCNDTLVENPRIVKFINATLARVQQAAVEQQLPFLVQQTIPKLEDTFWVKLIGLGYPAPNKIHRWCTDRLKIDPTTRFILDKVDENGEAIILLGTRSAESTKRAEQIKRNEVKGHRLRKHVLKNAYVYAPIKDVQTGELWQYLNLNDPPWGGTHKELRTLYMNANAGDCPLVIDDTTPSCGNSRFGCWVCTVVNKDKSMEGLIDSGEDWMEPLVEIRNFLVEARDNPEVYREKKRRNGTINDDKWGPYTFETRVEILRRVFEAQKEIQAVEPIQLITYQEMVLIQYYWFRDLYFKQKVSEIYNGVFNKNLNMGKHQKNFKQEEDLLKESCQQQMKDVELIQDMLALQKTKTLMIRKRGLQADLENRIEQFIEQSKQPA